MLELKVAPVGHQQVDDEWLPGYRPYEYQRRALELIRDAFERRETLCLFLITPTGSGKTLASYAYSLRTGIPILGIYPTNELIADQTRTLAKEYQRILGWDNWVYQIDSRALDELQDELEYQAHSETLEAVLNWRRVMLTNPDLLSYVAFGRYANRRLPSIAERLYRLVSDVYHIIAFDEFHLYNVKQVADVAFFISALHRINPNRPYVFIFASATPDEEVIELLRDRAGLRVVEVEAQPSTAADSRITAHPVELAITPADLDHWQGLEALKESFGYIDKFLGHFHQGRIVTILDSVAGAIELAQLFRSRYPNIEVGEVHGFSSQEERETALIRQITIGTSTIEVGVDFKDAREKDLLIFESRTSSQFIQRFGRIARHEKSLPIPNRALALVPPHVYHWLCQQFVGVSTITREQLREAVNQAYRVPEQFRGYLRKYASVEMRVASTLVGRLFQPDIRPQIMWQIDDLIERLTGNSAGNTWQKYRQAKEKGIIAPLLDFRGSQFEVAILDERGTDLGFPAKEYSLIFLLRRGIFQELTEDEYHSELEQLGKIRGDWKREIERARRRSTLIESSPEKLLGVYGFFRLTGMMDKSRRVWFEIPEENIVGLKGEVVVVDNISIATEPAVPLRHINRHLRHKQIVAWFIDIDPASIRLGRALPPLFEIYPLRVIKPGGRSSDAVWSIAFNQNAFFLDSLWWRKKHSDDVLIF